MSPLAVDTGDHGERGKDKPHKRTLSCGSTACGEMLNTGGGLTKTLQESKTAGQRKEDVATRRRG